MTLTPSTEILIGSETALRAIAQSSLKTTEESRFQFCVTDILAFILERKSVSVPLKYEILQTGFADTITAVRSGLVTTFDESFQYLILYSFSNRDDGGGLKRSVKIVVEDSWLEQNTSNNSERFVALSKFLLT